MARSPRGRCITCDKYTTLMYVDQCRTCFEFEDSIGQGGDGAPVSVTIHGRYGRGPMPVEFRDALVEMTRLVVEAVDRGELGRCPHGHPGCCGHHDQEDMPIHPAGACSTR